MSAEQRTRVCYVIMPFAKEYKATFESAMRPALEEVAEARGERWHCKRGDETRVPGSITKELVTSLHTADLVIADLAGHNPNVFYELGVAHSAGRRTVMLTPEVEDLPFDISAYRVLMYETSADGLHSLRCELVSAIHDALDTERQTNPVLDYAPIRHSQLLLHLHDVQQIERGVSDEVWLIQPSLDTDLKQFEDIIEANLKRGVKYRYLIRDEPPIRRQWRRFVSGLGRDEVVKGLLEARFVARHLIESEVVIYDAYSSGEEVLLMSPRERQDVFWYRVGQGRGEDIRDRYEALWEQASESSSNEDAA